MESSENKTFILSLNIDSASKSVEVTINDTTDGLPFYVCKIDGSEVQLRKEDQWEVIWGNLSQKTLEELGSAIDKQIIKTVE